jgi:hypothetical protein
MNFEKTKNFFKKKKKSTIIYNKKPKNGFTKKRKSLKINFEFLKRIKSLKNKYIPYLLIIVASFIILITILII